MATINDYITPDQIQSNHNDLVNHLQVIADLEHNKLQMDQEKEVLWAQLLEVPGFKPGRSNMEQSAKLRENFPEFMQSYDTLDAELRGAKLDLEIAREKTSYFNRLLNYFNLPIVYVE